MNQDARISLGAEQRANRQTPQGKKLIRTCSATTTVSTFVCT